MIVPSFTIFHGKIILSIKLLKNQDNSKKESWYLGEKIKLFKVVLYLEKSFSKNIKTNVWSTKRKIFKRWLKIPSLIQWMSYLRTKNIKRHVFQILIRAFLLISNKMDLIKKISLKMKLLIFWMITKFKRKLCIKSNKKKIKKYVLSMEFKKTMRL